MSTFESIVFTVSSLNMPLITLLSYIFFISNHLKIIWDPFFSKQKWLIIITHESMNNTELVVFWIQINKQADGYHGKQINKLKGIMANK